MTSLMQGRNAAFDVMVFFFRWWSRDAADEGMFVDTDLVTEKKFIRKKSDVDHAPNSALGRIHGQVVNNSENTSALWSYKSISSCLYHHIEAQVLLGGTTVIIPQPPRRPPKSSLQDVIDQLNPNLEFKRG